MWPIALIFSLLTRPVFAQNTEFAQFKNDYTFQYNQYLASYSKYLEKKDIYTKYGSVSTEADKLDAAKTAINNRNSALKSYIQALRVYLNGYQDADPANTKRLQIELQNWEDWLNEQLTVVPNINNSKDLSKWAGDFQTKYMDIQQSIYTALVYNQINKEKTTLGLINTLSDTIKSDPNVQNQSWVSNLTIKSDLANQSLQSAANLTTKKQYQTKFSNFYPDSKSYLSTANNYLQAILKDLKIIIITTSNGN